MVGSFLLPYPARDLVHLVILFIGVTALIVSIVQNRPVPAAGWWLVAVSGLLTGTAFALIALMYGMRGGIAITTLMPVVPGIAAWLFLAAGLAVLGRRGYGVSDWADSIDALMTAFGVLLLIWVLYIEPELAMRPSLVATALAIAVPAGALIIFTTAVKLALSGAWRTWSGLLLLLAVLMAPAAAGIASYPVGAQAVRTNLASTVLLLGHAILLGAAGNAPGFTEVNAGPRRPPSDLAPSRVILYAVLALLAPAYLGARLARADGVTEPGAVLILVPAVCAAAIFLLLVLRLWLVAKLAQGQAAQLARAVAEQHDLQQQLAYRAHHDPLTGLPNRIVLIEHLEGAQARPGQADRPGNGQALMLLDLDGFKDVNDTFGHQTGDRLLIAVAGRLQAAVGHGALAVRLGGDEFAILLQDTPPAQARQRAQEILEAMRSPHLVDGHRLYLSASIGLLTAHSAGQPLEASTGLRDADIALYAAKGAGRNRVVEFDPHMRAARMDSARIATSLGSALSNNELILHYQPVVRLDDGAIVGVEALVRWRPGHGDRLVPPDEFIPVAEQTGLIIDIGTWALRQACRDAHAWYTEHGVTVGVNVSGRQLADSAFADIVLAALSEARLPAPAVVLELTESSLVEGLRERDRLDQLRGRGVQIAIDDFGTGYSSLSYLSRLPVDMVKIDSSFTLSPPASSAPRRKLGFVQAIVQLISYLDLPAVAEGIETQEQADALREMNCPLAQGRLFSPPITAQQVDRLLAGEHLRPILGDA